MSSEVFSTTHILIVAAISGVLGGAVTWWWTGRRSDGLAVMILSFAATALWRKSANLPQLNTDGLQMFSANDWAAPMLTFAFLRGYALTRPATLATTAFGQATVYASLIAVAVNVIGI